MMLPAFRISNLPPIATSGPKVDNGPIKISEAEYDTLSLWHPVARLKYVDEDGEIITVGSSYELKDHLEATLQRRRKQNIVEAGSNDAHPTFLISEAEEAIGKWHLMASEKSLPASEALMSNPRSSIVETQHHPFSQSIALKPDQVILDDPRARHFIASNPPRPFSGTRCIAGDMSNGFTGKNPASQRNFPSTGLTPIGRRQAISAADRLHGVPNIFRYRVSAQTASAPSNRWASYVTPGSAFPCPQSSSVFSQAAPNNMEIASITSDTGAEAAANVNVTASGSLMQIFESEFSKKPKGDHTLDGSPPIEAQGNPEINLKRIQSAISKITSALGDLNIQKESVFTLEPNYQLIEELQAVLCQLSDCTHRATQSLQGIEHAARNMGDLMEGRKVMGLENSPDSPSTTDTSSASNEDGHETYETSFTDEHSDVSTLSKVQSCVETLRDFGYDSRISDRLVIYAQAADGDVEAAIDLIEEDERVCGVGIRL